jgi:hypothetical protein
VAFPSESGYFPQKLDTHAVAAARKATKETAASPLKIQRRAIFIAAIIPPLSIGLESLRAAPKMQSGKPRLHADKRR